MTPGDRRRADVRAPRARSARASKGPATRRPGAASSRRMEGIGGVHHQRRRHRAATGPTTTPCPTRCAWSGSTSTAASAGPRTATGSTWMADGRAGDRGPDAAPRWPALVLDEEARRHAAQGRPEREYTDDELMVVGDEVSLADAFRQGGVSLLVALMAVAVVQSLDNAALGVLAPDIQESLGVSSAVLGAIGGAAGVLFVMGAIPIAALADRRRRTTIAGACTFGYGLLSIATAAVGNAFWLFAARMGSGPRRLAHPARCTTRCWPTPTRSGPGAASTRSTAWARRSASCSGPSPSAPSPASSAASRAGGGPSSPSACRRWALSLFVATRREPARGMNEQIAVLGETHRGRAQPGADLDVHRVRPAEADPHVPLHAHRHRRARLRPVQRADLPQHLHGGHVRAVRASSEASVGSIVVVPVAGRAAVRGPAQRPAVPRVAAAVAGAVRRADLAVRRVRDRGAVHAERGVVRGGRWRWPRCAPTPGSC